MLKLMYITNRPDIAQIAETAGVDRIFVDMEFIGKDERQKGLDTVKSLHTFQDVANIKQAVESAEVLVRVNPIHDPLPNYPGSAEEIERTIAAGADIIMLPYFKTVSEVETFLRLVRGRAATMLLVETPEAVAAIDEILALDGIDEIHIGLNDLSLGYGMHFMFELLADGTVERLCRKFREKGVKYGFGGIASLGKGLLPAERVIREHYRLGSTCVILSRSFCNTSMIKDYAEIEAIFRTGMAEIRALEAECRTHSPDDLYFRENRAAVEKSVAEICRAIEEKNR